MTRWRVLTARLSEWIRQRRIDVDTDAELQAHLDHLADDYVRRGLSPDEARRAARRDFGGLEQTREAVRDRRGLRPLDTLLGDVRYAARLLVKAPGFSVAAIATIALGIGAATTIFTLVDGVMLRPLPYTDPGRLVAIWELLTPATPQASEAATPERIVVAPANLADYQRARLLTSMAGFVETTRNFVGAGSPERLVGEEVTGDYFAVLGVPPLHGRGIAGTEAASGAKVMVVSHAFWRDRLGGTTDAIGRSVRIDDIAYEIVGVMPESFRGVSELQGAAKSYWIPLAFPADVLSNRMDHQVAVVARLAASATSTQLGEELRGIAASFPPPKTGALSVEVTALDADVTRDVRPLLLLLSAAVALVLLLACVNVASLLIVRSIARRREIAVRLALGATRARVVRELLTQSVLLAVCAAIAGFGLAVLLTNGLLAVVPISIPRLDGVAIDGRALWFAIGVSTLTGLLFGALPALQLTRSAPGDVLATTERVVAGSWASRARAGLMMGEIALATLLIVGAALMVRSLMTLNAVPLGFDSSNVLTANVRLPDSRYAATEARLAFFERVAAEAARLPGAQSVSFGNRLPLRGGWTSGFIIEPATELTGTSAGFQAVSPAYFDLYRIPILRGRGITDGDREGRPGVAVVNEEFVRRFFPNVDPIGQRVKRFPKAPPMEIVGVVGDVRRTSRERPVEPELYLPAAQTSLYPLRLEQIAVRFSQDPALRAADLRAAIWTVDPAQPVAAVRTLDEILALQQGERRFQALLIAVFAALALALTVVGIYGVVAYAVSQRTPEIALRMALGATTARIHGWILMHWLRLIGASAAIGLGAALLLGGLVRAMLFGVTPVDAPALGGAVLVIAVTAATACLVAARGATRVDAASVLK
jgi:putative ABC transport system permease protein